MVERLRKNRIEIEPEEILLDKKSASQLEIPIQNGWFFALFAAALLILSVFLSRAFYLQIIKGDYYSRKASQNAIRLYDSQPPRGLIYDRNGKIIAANIPDFDLLAIPSDIPKKQSELDAWTNRVAGIVGKKPQEISDFVNNLNKNSAQPVSLGADLDQTAIVNFETHQMDLPGLFINKSTKREYSDGLYFSHLLGYVGKVSADDIANDSFYSPLGVIGKNGLESQYEKDLRGTPGKVAVSANSGNGALKTLAAQDPQAGDNLVLNIDGNLQKILTDALKSEMTQTNSPGAAAVVLDVNSGRVLSLVSLPNFDNGAFSSGISQADYQKLIDNPAHPFFNRAIAGYYPSGSTIKPFLAAAALAENIIDPNYQIDDTLGYITIPNQYNSKISYTYHDWRPQGFVDMRKAIAVSADVYFYEIGGGYKNIKGLGIDRIKKYLDLFGFGSDTGIDLPGETGGLVPDPAWKKSVKHEDWYTGDTYNVSIGQGDVAVTPLQLAAGIAAIANGGALYKPRLVSKITDQNNQTIKEFQSEIERKIGISGDNLQIVREGMRDAVTEGSVRLLNSLPIKVAGKTGTAQVYSNFTKTNAWFTGFAPYEDPKIAVAVVLEGAGEGSSAAVPVAKEVFQWFANQTANSKS